MQGKHRTANIYCHNEDLLRIEFKWLECTYVSLFSHSLLVLLPVPLHQVVLIPKKLLEVIESESYQYNHHKLYLPSNVKN